MLRINNPVVLIVARNFSSTIMLSLFLLVFLVYASPLAAGLDFLFNSFSLTDIVFTGDATIDSSVIRLTGKTEIFSMGRVLYPYPLPKNSRNMTAVSFSTSFAFSIVAKDSTTTPGFGLTFVLSNTTVPPGALSVQYFGLFNPRLGTAGARFLAVEFDCGQNPELGDPDGNHVGLDLNGPESSTTREAGYYNSITGEFVPIKLRSGNNIQAWIELDGTNFGINVTIAPVGIPKPDKPLISFYDPIIASYVVGDMFVGFSASRTSWIETQRILAWTLATEGEPRDINTSNLPFFSPENPSKSSLSVGLIVGIVLIVVLALLIFSFVFYWFWIRRRISHKDDDEVQSWALEYWPHRFTYEELARATNGFSEDQLLGFGGFGRVYKGTEANSSRIAVKCISRGSKQGLKEFMAEISSTGRLQHKNLVRLRGWCKRGSEMFLVYDYMPNGSLYSWIFTKSVTLSWQGRLLVLTDVAEGLNYLHNGWDDLVLHCDIKSGNVLLDEDMRGRLGDFGLAKLCKRGQSLSMTTLVGTIGYMAPELVRTAPTKASDTYSFGVVVLEVACGRRPTKMSSESRELVLVDWVRTLQKESRLNEAADLRIAGEYNVGDMETVLKLGTACCDTDPELRPSMKEVLSSLLSLKLSAASSSSSCKFHHHHPIINYGNQDVTSQVSIITEPGPRT